MQTSKEQLTVAIKKFAQNNKLSCEQAHKLAAELKVSLRDVGATCNELKVKITACQLGCF